MNLLMNMNTGKERKTEGSNFQHIKMIVFDVDGTLVNDVQVLGERTVSAIHELQKRGVVVSIATGKIFPSVREVMQMLGINVPVILANGALIQYPDERILYKEYIDLEIVREVIQIEKKYKADLALFTPKDIYVKEENHNTDHISVEFKEKITVVGKWEFASDHLNEVCKAIWINRSDQPMIQQLTSYLQRVYAGSLSLSTGAPCSIEAMPVGISKQSGLVRLTEYLNIPMRSVMVFGDQINDLEMLQTAGISVAMGNAVDIVKDSVDFVIGTNNEEGVAKFVEKSFLGK